MEGVDKLPDELLLQIFHYFSFKTIVTVLPRVSLRWSRVARDQSLFRKITAKFWDLNTGTDFSGLYLSGLANLLRQNSLRPFLLTIDDESSSPASIMDRFITRDLTTWTHLKCLTLAFVHVSENVLVKLFLSLDPREFVYLKMYCVATELVKPMRAICSHLLKIKELAVVCKGEFCDEWVNILASNRLPDLHSLTLGANEKDVDRRLSIVLRAYASQLETLDICEWELLPNDSAENIAQILRLCKRLRSVSCELKPALATSLQDLLHLEELNVKIKYGLSMNSYENFTLTCLKHLIVDSLLYREYQHINMFRLLCKASGHCLESIMFTDHCPLTLAMECVMEHCPKLLALSICTISDATKTTVATNEIFNQLDRNPKALPQLKVLVLNTYGEFEDTSLFNFVLSQKLLDNRPQLVVWMSGTKLRKISEQTKYELCKILPSYWYEHRGVLTWCEEQREECLDPDVLRSCRCYSCSLPLSKYCTK